MPIKRANCPVFWYLYREKNKRALISNVQSILLIKICYWIRACWIISVQEQRKRKVFVKYKNAAKMKRKEEHTEHWAVLCVLISTFSNTNKCDRVRMAMRCAKSTVSQRHKSTMCIRYTQRCVDLDTFLHVLFVGNIINNVKHNTNSVLLVLYGAERCCAVYAWLQNFSVIARLS